MRHSDREPVVQFWATLSPPLSDVLVTIDELHLTHRIEAFVHGDLRADNVVQRTAGGGPSIVDRQQCGYASAMADLAFLDVRLAPSGQVAPPAFLDTYAASRGMDAAEARLGAMLAELATYVFLWPPFAASNTAAGVANVRNRGAEIARWTMREVAAT